jgi:hypothetical protein
LYLKRLAKELLCDRSLACEEDRIAGDDVCTTRILEKVYRHNMRIFLDQFCCHGGEKYCIQRITLESIQRKYEHDLACLVRLAHDEMPPESYPSLGIIGRKW